MIQSKNITKKQCLSCAKKFMPTRGSVGKYCSQSCYRKTLKNGRTLCVECHKQTDTFARKLNKSLC